MKKKSTAKRVLTVVGGIALTIVGFMVIPSLIQKYGNKLAKRSYENDEIDFESMGPEIVRKEHEDGEKKEDVDGNN